jgi:PleD family two-component response regulator
MSGVEAALERLQKILQAFNQAPGATFKLSLSWGVSAYDPEHPVTIEELLIRADKLMYEHKSAKRRA